MLDPIVRAIARTGITPNGVTSLGFAVNGLAAVLVGSGRLLAGGLVMLAGSALDLVDGALARATGRASRYGAIFDAVLDRYSEVAVLLGILVWAARRERYVEVALVFAAITGSVLVSYVRARAEMLGFTLREGLFTRPERVVLTAVALIAAPWQPKALALALWLLAALTHVTALQRVAHVRQMAKAATKD